MLLALRILTLLLLGTPLMIFGSYGMLMLYYYKKAKNRQQDETAAPKPTVSVVIPTHNEELMIPGKIENLLASNYPQEKLEIICIDDSDDSTPRIIKEYSDKYPNIHLIRFDKRMGYSPCVIAGCKAATGEVIVLNDAGSLLESNAIPNLTRHFQDPDVGGVTGRAIVLNENEATGRSEEAYLKASDIMRVAEAEMDSTFHFNGEACAFRKELISDLESCRATFDTAAALYVRQKGYRTIYDPSVKFYEYTPQTHSGRIKQKTIRATNLIRILFEFRKMMFKRKYGKFGCIILPMSLAMLVLVPIAILFGSLFLVALTLFDFAFVFLVWCAIGLVLILSLAFSREISLTFLEFEYSLLKALYRVILTRKTYDKIEKVISTRRIMNESISEVREI